MKQIIVNVDGLTNEEKQRVGKALAKIKNIRFCEPVSGVNWDGVKTMIGPADGAKVGRYYWNWKGASPTHTTQEVLEMAGMATKRKAQDQFLTHYSDITVELFEFLKKNFQVQDSASKVVVTLEAGSLVSISVDYNPKDLTNEEQA